MNRNKLFAAIEYVERSHAHAIERPAPRPAARAEEVFRPKLTATPAALATAAKRPRRTLLPTVVLPPPRDPKGAVKLNAKAPKVTMMLDPVALGKIEVPAVRAVLLVIDAAGRKLRTQVAAKSLRKAVAMIGENGAEQVVVIVQGKLESGDVVSEAGIVAQVKTPKPASS